MNIHTLEYDDYLIDWFGVGKVKLPKIVASSDSDAYGSITDGSLAGVRISGCLGIFPAFLERFHANKFSCR